MSLFNKGGDTHSDSSQKTTTQNTSENTSLGNSSGGINIGQLKVAAGSDTTVLGKGGGGGVNITQTDSGAITGSLDLARAISAKVIDFATSTTRTVADTTLSSEQNAFDFGRAAFSEVDRALQSTISTNNAAFETVAKSQSTNVALSDLANNFAKYGVVGVGLLVGGVVLFMLFRKG